MEKSNRGAVVKLDHKWSDLGNFDALYDEIEKDEKGNVIYDSDDVLIDSTDNLVYLKGGKIVSLIDVNDMVVVDTSDALLVCLRGSSQRVKDVVTALKDSGDKRAFTRLCTDHGGRIRSLRVQRGTRSRISWSCRRGP